MSGHSDVSGEWPARPLEPGRDPQLNVHSFGCLPDNATDNRGAIARALAACKKAGGCTLTFPGPGIYVSGPIRLVSNLTLVIAAGATLHGARSKDGWPVLPYAEWPSLPNGVDPPGGGQLGPYVEPNGSYVGWVRGYNVTDVTLTGGGTLDGGGELWRKGASTDHKSGPERPYMLHFEGMQRVHLTNLRVQNSGFWTIHFQYSSDIVVERLSVYNPAGGNADGIDIDSSQRALVRESSWDVGDDMLCVKAGKNWAAWGPTNRSRATEMPVAHVPAQHILFIDNECRAGGGITIGSEGSGGVHNVTFENIFYNSSASEAGAARRGPSGPDMKSQRGMGSSVTDIRFKNIWGGTADCGASITMCHHNWAVGTLPTPRWANISFADIDLEVKTFGGFVGLPESPIDGLFFENVTFRLAESEEEASSNTHPQKGSWDCSACFGRLHASGTADGLSPPLTGNCALPPA